MKIEEYFDRIYCINLKNRTDRWNDCQSEFRKHHIKKVKRVYGINGIPKNIKPIGSLGLNINDINFEKKLSGHVGCALSHLKIIKSAQRLKLKRILILEDDVQFINDFQMKFDRLGKQIPLDWSLLYLGGNEKGGQKKISKNILQVSHMLMTHAVGIDSSAYKDLIKFLSLCDSPVDKCYAKVQKIRRSYAIHPYMAWQRAGWSDIAQRFRIYDFENPSSALASVLSPKLGKPLDNVEKSTLH